MLEISTQMRLAQHLFAFTLQAVAKYQAVVQNKAMGKRLENSPARLTSYACSSIDTSYTGEPGFERGYTIGLELPGSDKRCNRGPT